MPKETFFHLKEEKRLKVENALIHEFSRNSFEEASISNIVQEAEIPRGSFYQYFEDKKDAIEYVIQKFVRIEHEKIYHLLEETKGDIFATSLEIYDYMVERTTQNDKVRLVKNVLQELRKNSINLFENDYAIEYKKQIDKIINKENLNLEQKDDFQYILKILTIVIRTVAIEVISNQKTKKEGKEELEKEIEILKKGMQK